MSDPAQKVPSYQDILSLPPELRGEIIFDQLYTSPRPSPAHQTAMLGMATRLDGSLGKSSGSGGGDWIFLTEPELHLGPHVMVPDLSAWRVSRISQDFYSKSWISILPDWVCEIQSPSTARVDRVTKWHAYFDLKIPYYWLLDPLTKTLTTFKHHSEGWLALGSFVGDDCVRAEPFQDLEIDLKLFWVP
jgi:Uma2 family endonuclease